MQMIMATLDGTCYAILRGMTKNISEADRIERDFTRTNAKSKAELEVIVQGASELDPGARWATLEGLRNLQQIVSNALFAVESSGPVD